MEKTRSFRNISKRRGKRFVIAALKIFVSLIQRTAALHPSVKILRSIPFFIGLVSSPHLIKLRVHTSAEVLT